MSNIFREQESREAVIRTDTQKALNAGMMTGLKAPQISRSGLNPGRLSDGSGKNVAADQGLRSQAAAREAYLGHILEDSADRNLAFTIAADRMLEKDSFDSAAGEMTGQSFRQQYPSAVRDRFFASSEDAAVRKYRSVFGNADLNTAREFPSLRRFVRSDDFKEGPVGEGAKDEIFNQELKRYINYLLRHPIDSRTLTEDYLSKHITEVYEFSWKLSKYRELKAQYPDFFSSVPETKMIFLEQMAASSEDLSHLISSHLRLHGITVTADNKGTAHVSLKREGADAPGKSREEQAYGQEYDSFVQKVLVDKDQALAEQFVDNKFTDESREFIEKFGKTSGEDAGVSERFGSLKDTALDEIRKTLSVRDQLIEEQRRNLAGNDGAGGRQGSVRRAIKQTNDRLMLCSERIDNYRQYLYFLNGRIETLPEDTADFLMREKHEELLEPLSSRAN